MQFVSRFLLEGQAIRPGCETDYYQDFLLRRLYNVWHQAGQGMRPVFFDNQYPEEFPFLLHKYLQEGLSQKQILQEQLPCNCQ